MRIRVLAAAGALLLLLSVIVLGVAQAVLPGIAASRLRDQLAGHGRVLSVQVHAFPAIELLWHQADSVVVRMADYSSSASSLQRTLGQVGDTGSLDASARVLHAGLLTVHGATLHKRGTELVGRGTVTESDLRTSFPVLDAVTPVAAGGGELTLQGTATLFGVSATVDATVRPDHGTLVVSPDLPFGGLATVTLFASPSLAVTGISATQAQGGFAVSVEGRLR